jgi:hypothetical protein
MQTPQRQAADTATKKGFYLTQLWWCQVGEQKPSVGNADNKASFIAICEYIRISCTKHTIQAIPSSSWI